MSADAARLLVSRQRVRNRVLIVVAVAAAMLDAALIVLLVAAISRAVAGVAVSLVLIAVVVTVSAVDAARSAGRVRGGSPDAAQTARLGPIVTRLAEGLGVEVPALWIADDDAVNAFSAYSGRRATIFYTRGFLEEFGNRGDDALVEAVTAHVLARVAFDRVQHRQRLPGGLLRARRDAGPDDRGGHHGRFQRDPGNLDRENQKRRSCITPSVR